jgi:hypothetical protein
MAKVTGPAGLPAERRSALLADARRLAGHLNDPGACGQAAVALVILRSHGLDGLRQALQQDLPAGGAAAPWAGFRRVMRVYVAKGPYRDSAELAFLLGWLKRLAKISDAGPTRQVRRR